LNDLDLKEKLIYSSTGLIKALGVSSKTFYRHARKLNISPKKKYGSHCRFWTQEDAIRILCSIYTPIELLSYYIRKKRANKYVNQLED
jgi:hypothetical protein